MTKDVIWKIAVATFAIPGCATLALRAGKPSSVTATNTPTVTVAALLTSNDAKAPQFGDSQCVSTVPRSWGRYRGGSSQAGLAFEASDGTLRFVTDLPCGATPIIALEVLRTPAAGGSSIN
jgi:hypothetical protein